jgi:hypothetical protein
VATQRKTPEELYEISQGLVADPEYGSRPWLERCLERYEERKKHDITPRAVPAELADKVSSLQLGLYFLALMQLRWGFEGLRETMDELDSLLPMLDTAFTDLRMPWDSLVCRLEVLLYLDVLLDRPQVAEHYFQEWANAASINERARRLHEDEVELYRSLIDGKTADLPCAIGWSKVMHTGFETYFKLATAIATEQAEEAAVLSVASAKLYKQRVRGGESFSHEGFGPDNYYVFDFRLAAIVEFARRSRGWELPVDETHAAALKNAASFREQQARAK